MEDKIKMRVGLWQVFFSGTPGLQNLICPRHCIHFSDRAKFHYVNNEILPCFTTSKKASNFDV